LERNLPENFGDFFLFSIGRILIQIFIVNGWSI